MSAEIIQMFGNRKKAVKKSVPTKGVESLFADKVTARQLVESLIYAAMVDKDIEAVFSAFASVMHSMGDANDVNVMADAKEYVDNMDPAKYQRLLNRYNRKMGYMK